jgi:hypothetical protein
MIKIRSLFILLIAQMAFFYIPFALAHDGEHLSGFIGQILHLAHNSDHYIALVCLVVSFAMLTLAWCKIKQLVFLQHSHKEIT